MAKILGRKVRWSRSTDSGSTYVPFAGSKSDTLNFTRAFAEAKDKGDAGWQSFLAEEAADQGMTGETEIQITDTTIAAAILNKTSDFDEDLKVDVDGLFSVTGKFLFTTLSVNAPDAEIASMTVSVQSNGALTYAAAV